MNDAETDSLTTVSFRAGEIRVRDWPPGLPVPFGLRCEGDELRGPARLRARVLANLRRAGVRVLDAAAPGSPTPLPPATEPPTAPTSIAGELVPLLAATAFRGVVVGLPLADRTALVEALVAATGQRVLLLVLDSGAQHTWSEACRARGIGDFVDVRTVSRAARDLAWLGGRYEVLVLDDGELLPWYRLGPILDAAVATARIAFLGGSGFDGSGVSAGSMRIALERLSSTVGSLVAVLEPGSSPRCCEFRVPMPADRKAAYAEAWHRFFAAYDRFVGARVGVSFGAFVRQARGDPDQRPALTAWHDAVRIASWHDGKAALTAALLRRHRDERILLFTPDRRVAYALAKEHLIAAVTAELALAERGDVLRAFADGDLRVLAGPRLLDLGVPEACADVGILVGGGFGASQREARRRRVRPGGVLYELVSSDTVEVGRAHRWRGGTAEVVSAGDS